ncbi:MAG: protein kinase [Minicystis sp.]
MPRFGKRTKLGEEHFAEFEKAYGDDPHGKSPRRDTGPEGRFRRFTREEIRDRGDNLDIAWLKDEDVHSVDRVDAPDENADSIVSKDSDPFGNSPWEHLGPEDRFLWPARRTEMRARINNLAIAGPKDEDARGADRLHEPDKNADAAVGRPALVKVFISYAMADERLCRELREHLALMERDEAIEIRDRRQLRPGDQQRETIAERLENASIVVALLSASYFSEEYEAELVPAMQRARTGKVRVIPVVVRACDWQTGVLRDLAPLPRNGLAIESWPTRDEAWGDVVRALRQATGRPTASMKMAPEPAYESDEIRAVAHQLERARTRRATLREVGTDTAAVDEEILDLRRRLREGGHLRAGDTLGDGRYLLLQSIGQGGFASVWEARDRRTADHVAIKVLHPAQAREASRRERFFRGARVMAALQHPAVVRVLETHGEDGGYLYFVMELVRGLDLHRAVLKKQVSLDDVVPLMLGIADALAEAHAKGIVHRDVKPANILLDEAGAPRLTDFDLVAARDTTGGTRTGAMGTFLFTAPEQINNAKEADARADVYGLGMTAIFCLHGGNLPVTTVRRPEKVIAMLRCTERVKKVLTQAIEVEVEERYEDARVFCKALREAITPPYG